MSTDAIVLLKQDHKDVREQFRAFRKPDQTPVQKLMPAHRVWERFPSSLA